MILRNLLNNLLDKAIRDYLNNPTDPQDKNRYVRPDGKLVGDLENALKEIKNNPDSQDSFYALLDAIHEYNTGKGIVTPRKIFRSSQRNGR